jgi:hypothetical protein
MRPTVSRYYSRKISLLRKVLLAPKSILSDFFAENYYDKSFEVVNFPVNYPIKQAQDKSAKGDLDKRAFLVLG